MYNNQPFFGIDVETNMSFDPHTGRITQIGFSAPSYVVEIDINPRPHGEAISSLTPTFADAVPTIISFINQFQSQGYLVAYNRSFDVNFINAELVRNKVDSRFRIDVDKVIDPLPFARRCHRDLESRSLGSMCKHYGITTGKLHQAGADAKAVRLLLLEMQSKGFIPLNGDDILEELHAMKNKQPDLFNIKKATGT